MATDPKEPQQSPDFPDAFYRVTVKGLLVQDDKLMMVEDAVDYPLVQWELPGGGLDFGETDPLRRFDGVAGHCRSDRYLVEFDDDAEILERALDEIGVRLNVADTGLTAVSAEDGERRRFILCIKISDAGALPSCSTIKNRYYGIAFLSLSLIVIFRLIVLVSRFRYSYNIRKIVC